jgi:hypothetical protein
MHTPTQITELARDLYALMSLEGDFADAASFPALTSAPRVVSVAQHLEIQLGDTSAILEVLEHILNGLKKEEELRVAAHEAADLAHMSDTPLAEPAMAMLGLMPVTEKKGIGARRAIAAPLRGVTEASMRRHDRGIARELAIYLMSASEGQQTIAPPKADWSSLTEIFEAINDDPAPYIWGLDERGVHEFTVRLIASFRSFHARLGNLSRSPAVYVSPDHASQESFLSLHALAGNVKYLGFFATIPPVVQLQHNPTASLSRWSWLARVMERLTSLIRFQKREKDLLIHAYEEAKGNLHVFLSRVEASDAGQLLLARWAEDVAPKLDSSGSVVVTPLHREWFTGLSFALLLCAPDEIAPATQREIAEFVMDGDEAQRSEKDVAVLRDLLAADNALLVEDDPADRKQLESMGMSDVDSVYIHVMLKDWK